MARMTPMVPPASQIVHPKMLRAESESGRKPLADLRPHVGRLVNRALELAGISKQDASFQMHYADQGSVSRWCSGLERPAFDKLFTIAGFKVAYVQALAEHDAQFDVTTVITIKRVA